MNKNKLTIGIYAIQDIQASEYPGYVHDHAIAIMQSGKVIDYLQLERITQKKYDNKLHQHLYKLLKSKKLLQDAHDFIFVDNVIGRSFISSEGNLRFEAPLVYTLARTHEEGRLYWLNKHIAAYTLNHELAHIFSCLPFFGVFKENSLLIHFDGGASQSNLSAWHYKKSSLELIDYHWHLKYLSGFFNANALTFGIIGATIKEQNSVPGKIMGLAAYGNYRPDIERWLQQNNYFANTWKSKQHFIEKAHKDFGYTQNQIDQHDPFIQDILATFHGIFERETIKHIQTLKEKTKADFLYFTGGSALNIKLNTQIIENLGFKNVFIPPCTNDSGLALGAAAYLEWYKGNRISLHSPYLNSWEVNEKSNFTKETIEKTAALLLENKIVAICNNYGEIGPRALGNRSIVSLAHSKKIAQKVSMDIKKREWYRPIAPIMLEKNARYFTEKKDIHHLSKFMLLDFKIDPKKAREIEGVTHIDGTSRIQVLFKKEDNPFMWELLTFLDRAKKVKALINTSFNVQGKPIVQTRKDAFSSAKAMQLDALIYNGKLTIF